MDYPINISKLMTSLNATMPSDALVIWTTSPPVASKVKAGFLPPDLSHLQNGLMREIQSANEIASDIVVRYGFNVVDFYDHFCWKLWLLEDDGVHWKGEALRDMSGIMLKCIKELRPRPRSALDHPSKRRATKASWSTVQRDLDALVDRLRDLQMVVTKYQRNN